MPAILVMWVRERLAVRRMTSGWRGQATPSRLPARGEPCPSPAAGQWGRRARAGPQGTARARWSAVLLAERSTLHPLGLCLLVDHVEAAIQRLLPSLVEWVRGEGPDPWPREGR